MDLQLAIVIALAVLSAAYLAYRVLGSAVSGGKTAGGCCGCSMAASCGNRIEEDAERRADGACDPPPAVRR